MTAYTPDAYEIVDALEDVGITATVQYPYVIVHNPSLDPKEIAQALDIDPVLCCYNLNGNIRITCE